MLSNSNPACLFMIISCIIHYDTTDSLWWRQIQSLRLDKDIDIVKSSSFDFALTNSVLYFWQIVHLSDQRKINVFESNWKQNKKKSVQNALNHVIKQKYKKDPPSLSPPPSEHGKCGGKINYLPQRGEGGGRYPFTIFFNTSLIIEIRYIEKKMYVTDIKNIQKQTNWNWVGPSWG